MLRRCYKCNRILCDNENCNCKTASSDAPIIDLGIPEGNFKKFDTNKLRPSLIPEAALEEILKVFEYGAKKYGDFNWLDNAEKVQWTRYQDALERHLKKFKLGKDLDEESNLYELAHMGCNVLMLLEYQLNNLGKDNRRKQK